MEYLVTGSDGKEYGPANIDTLRQWAADGRIGPATQLRDALSGHVVSASQVQGIFPPAAPALGSAAPNAAYRPSLGTAQSDGVLAGVIWRSAAALVLFFVLHGIGLIFAGYALYFAIQAKSANHKHGVTALVIAGVTVAAVGIGWIMRLATGR